MVLGIDYGEKYVGLAIGDEKSKTAFPYRVLQVKNEKKLLDEIKEIIREEKIKEIVVGWPIGMSGKPTKQTKITDKFIRRLAKATCLPVYSFDERLTTKMVEATTKYEKFTKVRKNDEHAVAAAIILEDYLKCRI